MKSSLSSETAAIKKEQKVKRLKTAFFFLSFLGLGIVAFLSALASAAIVSSFIVLIASVSIFFAAGFTILVAYNLQEEVLVYKLFRAAEERGASIAE